MKLPLASLLLLGSLAQAAPAPVEIVDVDKRAVHYFKYSSSCREKPWGRIVANFKAGSYIDVSCYHWHEGVMFDVWYYTKYGCWVPTGSYNKGQERIPNLPAC